MIGYGAQNRVLSCVRGGNRSIAEIERLTGIPRNQAITHLRRLVEKGLVAHHGHNDWRPVPQCVLAEVWR